MASRLSAYVVVFALVASNCFGAVEVAFVTGPDPWGNVPTNGVRQNLNSAFGAGGWDEFTFGNAISSGILSTYQFIYIDGGDGASSNFEGFVNTNRSALESWVANGGSLLLNAARWTFTPSFNLGFGTTLEVGASGTASAVSPGHPIFDATTGLAWTGTSFSHDYIGGGGLTSIIKDGIGRSVLAERDWGAGHVMLGGMTHPYFHNPDPYADNLRVNILEYGASNALEPGQVPEPGQMFIWLGLALFAATVVYQPQHRISVILKRWIISKDIPDLQKGC